MFGFRYSEREGDFGVEARRLGHEPVAQKYNGGPIGEYIWLWSFSERERMAQRSEKRGSDYEGGKILQREQHQERCI